MSGATYRIEIEHHPEDGTWQANTVRLSDEFPCDVKLRRTAEEAISEAREWIRMQHERQEPFSLYVDDEGQDADAPHSVKA